MRSVFFPICLVILLVAGCAPEHKPHFEPVAGTMAYPPPETPATEKPAAAPPVAPVASVAPVRTAPARAPGFTIQTARFLNGRVATVNAEAGIAVVNFPIGQLPGLGQKLAVYRHGVGVGEIKITGPQRDDNIVGDILSGELQPGDEARNR